MRDVVEKMKKMDAAEQERAKKGLLKRLPGILVAGFVWWTLYLAALLVVTAVVTLLVMSLVITAMTIFKVSLDYQPVAAVVACVVAGIFGVFSLAKHIANKKAIKRLLAEDKAAREAKEATG